MDRYLLNYDSWKLFESSNNCPHEELDEERYCLECGEYILFDDNEEYNYQDILNGE